MRQRPERSLLPVRRLLGRWPMIPVAIAFVGAACVIPIGTAVAPADEWIYVRAIERLSISGVVGIPDAAAMNLVFHTVWGAFFAEVFGLSFTVLRSASALLVLGSALALYRLCLVLGIQKPLATLTASAYLFNPLTVVLGWSMMTDATFTALVVLATWAFIEGSHRDVPSAWIIVGSLFSCAAYLVRQPGILVPVAFVTWALTRNGVRQPRLLARWSLLAMGPAIVTAAAFSWWLENVHGTPEAQRMAVEYASRASAHDWLALVAGVAVVAAGWCGLFLLPLAAAALGDVRQVSADLRSSRFAVAIFAISVGSGMLVFALRGDFMPYAASWVTTSGVGPDDIVGGRFAFITGWDRVSLTLVALLALCIAFSSVWARRREAGQLLRLVFLYQLAGVIVVSMPFRTVPSLDRYMLPLLPLGLALTAVATPRRQGAVGIGLLVVALFAVYGVAGTRDWLTFEDAAWRTADRAVASGVGMTSIDGGAGWSGYHLYEYSRRNGLHNPNPNASSWIRHWDLATDGCLLVTVRPLDGMNVIDRQPFDQWFGRDGSIYLLQRCDPGGSISPGLGMPSGISKGRPIVSRAQGSRSAARGLRGNPNLD